MARGRTQGRQKLYTSSNGDIGVDLPVAAFGELLTAELTPVTQISFQYNLNNRLVETRLNSGTATVANQLLTLSTGASANQSATMLSRRAVKYNAGQGVLARFTALYTTGVANSAQHAGIGNAQDGFFFGYNGADFGILHRKGGALEDCELTITTASSTAENITITLNGNAVSVAVTASGNITTTANEIASHDYSNVGSGWFAEVHGDVVEFVSFEAETKGGAFTLSGATTAVGSFSQAVAGAAPTDTWITQADWDDPMDGTGASGMTLDPTKGNVFEINFQWLGFGAVRFYIESQATGEFVKVHEISYTNQNLTPSVNNPTLPLCAAVKNTSNTTDIAIKIGSMGGFIEGKHVDHSQVRHGVDNEITGLSTTELPVITIHNDRTFQGVENRVRIRLDYVGLAVSGGSKTVIIKFKFGTTLTDASFTAVDSNSSVMEVDKAATAVSGGVQQFSIPMQSGDDKFIDLTGVEFEMEPGDFFTVTAVQTSSGGASVVDVDLNWEELV